MKMLYKSFDFLILYHQTSFYSLFSTYEEILESIWEILLLFF